MIYHDIGVTFAREIRIRMEIRIQQLREIPHYNIHKILKISFDGLDCDAQSIFLDIVCAFTDSLRMKLPKH